jgi:hypothetical protein
MVFHVDVNVGDPVVPMPGSVELPRLRGGIVSLLGYPLAMVRAEKVVTMLERGEVNTRWRDFADLWTLSNHHPVNGTDLQKALNEVAQYRHAELGLLQDALDGYADIAQNTWAAWRRRKRL